VSVRQNTAFFLCDRMSTPARPISVDGCHTQAGTCTYAQHPLAMPAGPPAYAISPLAYLAIHPPARLSAYSIHQSLTHAYRSIDRGRNRKFEPQLVNSSAIGAGFSFLLFPLHSFMTLRVLTSLYVYLYTAQCIAMHVRITREVAHVRRNTVCDNPDPIQ
jgi:hypothetical protein